MSWIKVVHEKEAQGKLREIYDELMRRSRSGHVSNFVKALSLYPEAVAGHLSSHKAVMYSRGALSRIEREAIALAVSVANGCHY
jgi:uncharacterized peroxidase-related enzyme